MLENLREIIPKIKKALEKHKDIVFAYVFGSLAKGRITLLSDIDIAVYLEDSKNIDLFNKKIQILRDLFE